MPVSTVTSVYPWVSSGPPTARLDTAAVSVANGAALASINLGGTSTYDNSLGTTMTVSGNAITIPATGTYQIFVGGQWSLNATGAVRRLGIFAGGSQRAFSSVQNSSAITVEMSCADMVHLNASDTVQISAAQNSGGALNLNSAFIAVAWVSGA